MRNASLLAKTGRLVTNSSRFKRGGQRNERLPFIPPEDWYEPESSDIRASGFEIVVQPPGEGYQHVLTADEIRHRLAQLPGSMIEPLEFVQLYCHSFDIGNTSKSVRSNGPQDTIQ